MKTWQIEVLIDGRWACEHTESSDEIGTQHMAAWARNQGQTVRIIEREYELKERIYLY
jgi:hypothetical protein